MNQPIKPPQEATPQAAPQREADPLGPPPKARSAWRLVMTCLVLLLVVAAIVWWTKHQAVPEPQGRGGRNAVPMSIVPESVGNGDIGINLNALGISHFAGNRDHPQPDQRLSAAVHLHGPWRPPC